MPQINQRQSVCIIVPDYRDDGLHILGVTRKKKPNLIAAPGGKFEDEDKSLAQTAHRELLEETGLHVPVARLTPIYTGSDYVGWVCTAFMAVARIGRSRVFDGEPGTEVRWISSDVVIDHERCPFSRFYVKMFEHTQLRNIG